MIKDLTVKEALEAGYTHFKYSVADNNQFFPINSLNPDNVSLFLNGRDLFPFIYEDDCPDLVIDRNLFQDNHYQDERKFESLLYKAPDDIWNPFLKQMQEWYDNNKITQTRCVARIINRRL